MNVLVLPINEIKNENIFFLDYKKNILMDGIFTKLIFTNEWFTMNGIYIELLIQVKNILLNSNPGQKHTVFFHVANHETLIEKIALLERGILDNYRTVDTNKEAVYSIQQSLQMGYFKIHKDNGIISKNTRFTLKISGIWENAKNYGLSYKIMDSVNIL